MGPAGEPPAHEALGQWLQSVVKLDPLCALGAGFTERYRSIEVSSRQSLNILAIVVTLEVSNRLVSIWVIA